MYSQYSLGMITRVFYVESYVGNTAITPMTIVHFFVRKLVP